MADYEGRLSPACIDDLDEETLDPRIQVELEKLNKASEEINKLELELDDGRAGFRQALSESTQKLNTLAKKLGACVEKARPYYDARVKVKDAHIEAQKTALRFERACSMHEAAKEMVQLAEQGYMCREEPSDPAWQEMLNHATMKVNEAEKERNESEQEHMRTTLNFNEADTKVQFLQKDLKRAINKSKPYFEMKAKFNQSMEDQKRNIHILEEDVSLAKATYSDALKNLELISDDIHQQRQEKRKQQELGVREAGVGSESPSPPPNRDKGMNSVEGEGTSHISSCQGLSQATNTSSHAKHSNYHEDINYTLPSVIHQSVDKSRNPSYREAIERHISQTEGGAEDFPVPTFDEEYRALPNSRTTQGQQATLTTLRQSLSRESSIPKDFNNSVLSSSPSDYAEEQRARSQSSPTGRRRKLQGGLILKIDAAMDPLTQRYQATEIQPTRKGQRRRLSKDQSKVQRNVEFPKHNPFGSPTEKTWRENSMSNSPSRQGSFLAPGGQGIDGEDGSDTESIASTGPMLDDDQVELLTLEFSDQASTDDNSPTFKRQDWNRMSLPPKLSHLEQYIHPPVDKGDTSVIESLTNGDVSLSNTLTNDDDPGSLSNKTLPLSSPETDIQIEVQENDTQLQSSEPVDTAEELETV
ncbi:SH3 domain-binding protein 5-like [Ylistrum balloti]|uniref:SH3 domain-binding protein 5-like n=1 Tax=Ylistrum balloti TaxID=509963 RepID=UPI002905D5FD|nr:SH3 domain-binding protein 5-like [Ylistrum balloti]